MKLVMDWTDEDGEQNDEVCRISLDGQPIIEANHDDHGWDGMRAVISAMKSVAQACNWEILTIGREGV